MLEYKDMNRISDFNKHNFYLTALKSFPVTTSSLQQETMELPWSLLWGFFASSYFSEREGQGCSLYLGRHWSGAQVLILIFCHPYKRQRTITNLKFHGLEKPKAFTISLFLGASIPMAPGLGFSSHTFVISRLPCGDSDTSISTLSQMRHQEPPQLDGPQLWLCSERAGEEMTSRLPWYFCAIYLHSDPQQVGLLVLLLAWQLINKFRNG